MNMPYNAPMPSFTSQGFTNPNIYKAPQPFNNLIRWVNGIAGAKAYQIEPNTSTVLMDCDNNGIMYIKTCDNIGMSTIRTFQYSEITENNYNPTTANIDMSQYATKQELQNVIDELAKITQDNKPKESTKK